MAAKAAMLRSEATGQSAAAKTANLNNFLNNTGNVGREQMEFNMINSDPSKYYEIGSDGKIHYKGNKENKKSNGGKLKKKGIDYGF